MTMPIPNRTKLQELFAEMRRIEEHRSAKAEVQIMKTYKEMLKDLNSFFGREYAKYGKDDVLTYSMLAQKSQYARFLEEAQQTVDLKFKRVYELIDKRVKQAYEEAYKGMVNAVANSINNEELKKRLQGIELTPAEVIKAAVNNPVSKLTLPKTLEKARKQIVHNIKSTITNGLMNGDRMSTMASKIQEDVNMNYRKAMLIARTEVHRVRETGHNDASGDIDNTLAAADSDFRMVKIWKSMRDSSVRKTNKADHRKMEGQTVLQDEEFDLGRGVKAPCPGQSGTAYNDCNCRCYVSHDLMSDDEFFQKTGRHFKQAEKPKTRSKKPAKSQEQQQAQTQPETNGNKPVLSIDTFPDSFRQKTAKKQTEKFVKYVNSIDNADSDMLTIYNSIGKMESIESNGIKFKVSYGKSGHAVNYRYNGLTGNLVEASIKIPKLDGDNITGAAQTTAHEIGHLIDMYMRTNTDKAAGWISTAGAGMKLALENSRTGMSDKVSSLFKQTNEKIQEIRKRITAEYQEKIKKYKEDNEDIIKNMFSNPTAYKAFSKKYKALYTECEDVIDYETRNEMDGINALQDIYDALSAGKYRDTGVVRYGHGSKYYRDKESQIHEIWANYSSLSLTRPDLIELLREDKPELVAMLDEIKAEILKKVGEK